MHEGQGEVWARKKEVERRGKVILHSELKLGSLSACWNKHIFIFLKVKVIDMYGNPLRKKQHIEIIRYTFAFSRGHIKY